MVKMLLVCWLWDPFRIIQAIREAHRRWIASPKLRWIGGTGDVTPGKQRHPMWLLKSLEFRDVI